jgi:flavonol synthase
VTYSIPVIDLDAVAGRDAPRAVLDEIQEATEDAGVIQVVNHGVPDDLVDRVTACAGRLRPGRFTVGQFDNPADARAAGVPEEYLGLYPRVNLWPDGDPGLRDAASRYIGASRRVAERVIGLYERAWGVQAGTFPLSPLPYLTLTANRYPAGGPACAGLDEDGLLLGEHADGSAVTVIAQQGDHAGLQVQLPGGGWRPVPIVPGAMVILSGTLLARWTNGLLRPARHRVVAGGTTARRSAALFYHPGLPDVLEPLPAFLLPDELTGLSPVTTWDLVKDSVANYLTVLGLPGQASRREGEPYAGELAGNAVAG